MAPLLDRTDAGRALNAESDEFHHLFSALEYYIPAILAEVFAHWRWEALDGFVAEEAIKVGRDEMEFSGLAYLVSDQSVAPFHIRLQISRERDDVTWGQFRLGEPGRGNGGIMRSQHTSSAEKRLNRFRLQGLVTSLDWVFQVEFGERDPGPIS